MTAIAEACREYLLGKALIFDTVSQHAPTAESYLRKVIPASSGTRDVNGQNVLCHTQIVMPALCSNASSPLEQHV